MFDELFVNGSILQLRSLLPDDSNLTLSTISEFLARANRESKESDSQEHSLTSSDVLVVASVYDLLFMVGLCGNSSVMSIICYASQTFKDTTNSKEHGNLIFVIALCCVDLLVILSLPMTISNLLLGHWIFGSFLCKFYWLIESAGKIISTFILTALSYFRYEGVCHPHKVSREPVQIATLIILCLVAVLLLIPLPYSVQTVTTVLSKRVFFGTTSLQYYGTKCTIDKMGTSLFMVFTSYIFVLGYLIPLILLIFFYSRVIMKLWWHTRSVRQSRIPLKQITVYTVTLVTFYFLCYTPYWLGVLLSIIAPDYINRHMLVYIMYFIHALPYLNSSLNFIFYTMLNAQIQRKINGSRSESGSVFQQRCKSRESRPSSQTPAGGSQEGLSVSHEAGFQERSKCRALSETPKSGNHDDISWESTELLSGPSIRKFSRSEYPTKQTDPVQIRLVEKKKVKKASSHWQASRCKSTPDSIRSNSSASLRRRTLEIRFLHEIDM